MSIEKSKEEILSELNANREKINALKVEKKTLAETEKALILSAKEKGITLAAERYSRASAAADSFRSYGNGEEFTVEEFSIRSDSLSVKNGSKSNLKESETVFRNIAPFATRLGFLEKTGKDTYRKISGSILRKAVNE